MKYGLLTTTSKNIGDEVQALAAFRFLPKVDYLIHRERTDEFSCDEKVACIMNHWWLWSDKHFPPSDSIDPLYVSFHLQYLLRNNKFMNDKVRAHLKQHEPIGCRDQGTAKFLNENGINAYFSGCMTLTLIPNEKIKGKYLSDYILCVDAPKSAVEEIRKRTDKKVICIERHQNVCFSYEQRLKLAKFTLFLYHNASCVVTIALHAALPSTAFGTPVCVLDTENEEIKSRFDGLESCLNIVKLNDFIRDSQKYNINTPPPNPTTFMRLRDALVSRTSNFTHYDCNRSIFEDDYNPIIDIAEIMPYDAQNIYKANFFTGRRILAKAFIKRCIQFKERHDINASRKCENVAFLERNGE